MQVRVFNRIDRPVDIKEGDLLAGHGEAVPSAWRYLVQGGVLKRCVVQGVQACNLGVPILAEELEDAGNMST